MQHFKAAVFKLAFVMTAIISSGLISLLTIGMLSALVHPGLHAQESHPANRDSAKYHFTVVDTDGVPAPQRNGSANWKPALLGTQINFITQHLAPLTAPYAGVNSLTSHGDTQTSQAYGIYAGVQVNARLQGYLDVEMLRGFGISHATGVAGITNGDVLRQGSVDLGAGPYVARAYVRYTVPFTSVTANTLVGAPDQLPTIVASRRLELFAGKLAVTDLFDLNRYANTTRSQFMNWALFQNSAWDFAADTRGYSNGVALVWIAPGYSFRAGSFQMPTMANGNHFDSDLRRARGEQVELTVAAPHTGTVVRILGYLNHARMGSYRAALDLASAARVAGSADSIPNIVANDQSGRSKYGFGLNLEQPLADSGETGMFARLGWNDGANESFAFTEVDRHVSLGLQLSGAHWRRSNDRVGIAVVSHGIVRAHQEYLAAGGIGFLLGDGRLTYGPEQIFEAYYRMQFENFLQISPDLQFIRNPGYNRDRGTAAVASVRVNLRY